MFISLRRRALSFSWSFNVNKVFTSSLKPAVKAITVSTLYKLSPFFVAFTKASLKSSVCRIKSISLAFSLPSIATFGIGVPNNSCSFSALSTISSLNLRIESSAERICLAFSTLKRSCSLNNSDNLTSVVASSRALSCTIFNFCFSNSITFFADSSCLRCASFWAWLILSTMRFCSLNASFCFLYRTKNALLLNCAL